MIKWKNSYTVNEFYYGNSVILAFIKQEDDGKSIFDLWIKTSPDNALCHHVSGLVINALLDEYNEDTLEDRVRELAENGYFDDIIERALKDEEELEGISNEEFFNEKNSDIE